LYNLSAIPCASGGAILNYAFQSKYVPGQNTSAAWDKYLELLYYEPIDQ